MTHAYICLATTTVTLLNRITYLPDPHTIAMRFPIWGSDGLDSFVHPESSMVIVAVVVHATA